MKNRENKERKFWEKFARRYDSFIKNTVSQSYQTMIENINQELGPNMEVLEIGTATGIISFSIHTKVNSVIAGEIVF
jgi:ubiquinone/menaquinone biosynthesis C-methylase UbiE